MCYVLLNIYKFDLFVYSHSENTRRYILLAIVDVGNNIRPVLKYNLGDIPTSVPDNVRATRDLARDSNL